MDLQLTDGLSLGMARQSFLSKPLSLGMQLESARKRRRYGGFDGLGGHHCLWSSVFRCTSCVCRAFSRPPRPSIDCSDVAKSHSCRLSLALLDLLERPHGAVQRVSVISPKLGVGAVEGRVSVGLGLFDTVGACEQDKVSLA
jgi:hypothetical protein